MRKQHSILILIASLGLLLGCSKSKSNPVPAATGKFTFNGVVYSGPASGASYNGGMVVSIDGGGSKTITFYNVPVSSGGAVNIVNAYNAGVSESTDVYGSSNIMIGNSQSSSVADNGSVSLSGTLTKTGARSFEFTGYFQADLSSKLTAPVSGSGTY